MEYRRAYTLTEAARVLGTSEGALRQRIRRGTLERYKQGGRVYVYLPQADNVYTPESQALISAKDETIATLREQLEAERTSHAEARRIIAGLVERIPALEPPQDAETPVETPPSSTGPPEPERGGERRPWWRRVFGG